MAVVVAVALGVQALRPEFVLTRRADSSSYWQLSQARSARDLLGSVRTPGYPLFLRGVRALCPDLACLPGIQLALFGLAVLGLFAALLRFGLSPLGAFAATAPLLASPLIPYFAPAVMTEALSASLTLAVLALLLRLAARPANAATWALLGAGVFAAYQVRPANIFLVVLVPVALAGLRTRTGGPAAGRSTGATLAGAAALCLLPLAVWCGLRARVVADFGLVSFTGYHLTGIASSMLDEALVAELPPEVRVLAGKILERRREAGLAPVRSALPFARWWEKHNANIYTFALPVVRREFRQAARAGAEAARRWPRDVYIDRRLKSFGQAVIAARPGLYAAWLAGAWLTGLALLVGEPWIWATGLVAASAVAARWLARRRAPNDGQSRAIGDAEGEWPRALAYLALAAAYTVSALAVILFLQPPEWRYLLSVMLPLPGALAAVGVAGLRSLRRGAPGRAAPPPRP